MKYAVPSNAGLASEPRAAGRRAAKLLHALNDHVNQFVFDGGPGTIVEDVWQFRTDLIEKLRADGWRVYLSPGDRWQVLPPKPPQA